MLRLLGLDDEEIEALCVSRLCAGDEMLLAAQRELADLSPEAYSVVLNTLFDAIEDQKARFISWERIVEAMTSDGDEEPEGSESVLDELDTYLVPLPHGVDFEVHFNEFPAICGLYFSGVVRHELSSDRAAEFVRRLL